MGRKKTNYWYILVLTNEGPKFLTGFVGKSDAEWDMLKAPLEVSESTAKEVALGLMVNFFIAYPVCSPVELKNQPYFYDKGKFKWEWNDNGKKNDNAEDNWRLQEIVWWIADKKSEQRAKY